MRIFLNDLWKFETNGFSQELSLPHNFPIDVKSYPNPTFKKGRYVRILTEVLNKEGKLVLLRFHGIDYYSKIFVNSEKVFEHEGGYDLFEVDITDHLNFDGKDVLGIEVEDYEISRHPERIAGKQDWYGNATGIWQNVELWIVDRVHIKNVGVYPQQDLQSIDLSVSFSDGKSYPVNVSIINQNGVPVINKRLELEETHLKIPEPKLWSPESPYLYELRVSFEEKDNRDIFRTRFGMRHIKSKNGKIFLNGEPLYIFGALDQNFYPDTHYSFRNRKEILAELTKAKDMGLNLLRYHVKIPDDVYLDIADELGILVWIDLPYARELNENSKDYLESLLENVLQRHANHPSFVMLSLINESWGTDLSEHMGKKIKEWIKSFYHKAKKIDSTRLYVDNSACTGNYHVISDIDDFHFYSSYPYHNRQWDEYVRDFANGKFKTFVKDPEEKLPKILSEFGVWGLANPDTWCGFWSKNPITIGGMVFMETQPGKAIQKISKFHNVNDFIDQAQLNQLMGLKYQIEKIRMAPEISGYVITEFSDIAWEANGLLDFNRMPKNFYPYLKILNSKVLGIIPNHKFLIEGEKYDSELYVSNVNPERFEAEIIVKTHKKTLFSTRQKLKAFDIQKIGSLSVEVTPEDQSLFVEIFKDGRLISRNFYPVLFLPPSNEFLEVEDRNLNNSIKSSNTKTTIVWLQNKGFEFENFKVIDESEKIHAKLDWKCDWISGFTIFNSSRSVNIPAVLGGLDSVLSNLIIVPQNPEEDFNSKNSIVSKVIGWGYHVGSLVYVKKCDNKKFIFTTLRKGELSKRLISTLINSDIHL